MDGAFFQPVSQSLSVNERVFDMRTGEAIFTVLIPTFRDDPRMTIRALGACADAAFTRIILFDDGSGDSVRINDIKATLADYPGPSSFVVSCKNLGRAGARNRLLAYADTDWVLLLDADMLPDDHLFLTRYIEHMIQYQDPRLIVGGFSLKRAKPNRDQRLHALLSKTSECLNAVQRNVDPARYVFTSNVFVHREVLLKVAFYDGFQGWGWEDVDWGYAVAKQYPVTHIDNTATHLGLDLDAALLKKFGQSGPNFALLMARHPGATSRMPLTRAAKFMANLGPAARVLQGLFGTVATLRWLPGRLRLPALKLFRAAVYGRSMPWI